MKLLIVDDEPLARVGIRTIIPWQERGFEIIGEAATVEDALKMARRIPPDLALVDIVMPEKNGFELIREIRKFHGSCKFIIISCRSTIDYYRQAINLGVSEYIQKGTLEAEDLEAAVEKVRRQIEKDRLIEDIRTETGNQQSRRVLVDCFNRAIRGEVGEAERIASIFGSFGLHLGTKPFFIFISRCTAVPDIDETGTFDSASSMASLCEEIIRESGAGLVFKYQENQLAAIYCPGEDQQPELMAVEVCRRMQLTLQQLFDIDVAFGLSTSCIEPGSMARAYREAKHALDQSFFDGSSGIYLYGAKKSGQSETIEEIDKLKNAIFDIRTLGDTARLRRLSNEIVGNIAGAGTAVSVKTVRDLYLDILYHIIELLRTEKIPIHRVWTESRTPAEAVTRAVSLKSIHTLITALLTRIERYSREREADRHGHAVEMIKKHIAENLYGKISLESVSQFVSLSPNYVCRLFKRETGETLIAYAQRMKVETAKSLLLNSRRATEVAEKLGFTSESYFIKVFKKYTGMTTSEFLRNH